MKLIKTEECIAPEGILDGTIEEIIAKLLSLRESGIVAIKFEDDWNCCFYKMREETKEEKTAREIIEAEKVSKQKNKELKELKRLKTKYGE